MDNKEITRYFYETVVSENRLEELERFIAPDCVLQIGDTTVPLGLEGMRQHLIDVKKTYPDYTMTILRQYVDGDYVISEFIMQGTHVGVFVGITPTNKRLTFNGVDIDKVVDGKIVSHGGAVNTFETMLENGLIRPV